MVRRPFYLAIVILAMVSLACSVTIDVPMNQVTPGPTQEMQISVPEPDADEAEITLDFGAGKLRIAPGADGALVTGVATYNVDDLKPEIETDGAEIKIQTGKQGIGALPHFNSDIKNDWDLKFSTMPMRLTINAGAYESDLELGGLALTALEISDGASEVRVKFSEANLTVMDMLRYVTGASNVKLSGLANANFKSMVFRGGAGDYTLDFSGELQNDAVVSVEAGISRIVIIVPEGMAAKVVFKGGLANADVYGQWDRSGDEYELKGDGPKLIITVEMGAGNLELRTSD